MIKSRNVIEITGITELKFRTKNQGGEKYMYKRKSVENQKKKIVTVLIGMFLWGNSVDPIPLGLLIVLVAIPVVIIVCILSLIHI